MDDSEKRAVFAGLYAARAAPSSANASPSSSSSSSSDEEIPTPTPAAHASRVPHAHPSHITPRPTRRAPPSPSRSLSSDATVKPDTPSPTPARPVDAESSDAETLPPPSPTRPICTPSPPRSPLRPVQPRIITIDDVTALDDSPVIKDDDILSQQYPRLPQSALKFCAVVDHEIDLSDRADLPPRAYLPRGAGVLPTTVAAALKPFQRDGITFLFRLYERGRGGLLADAMGLGKTVQAVCFIGAAFAAWERVITAHGNPVNGERSPRVLIVAPTTLRENWRREFEMWTPLRVRLFERACEPELGRMLKDGRIDVLIAGDNPIGNYGTTFFSDPTMGDVPEWKWDIVIVDEIHIAKNANTKIFKALKKLPKSVMFGLTGTAVQNKLKELWNVLSLVVPPTYLPAYTSFRSDFIDVINKGTKKDASKYMRKKAKLCIDRLRTLLAKHMVRRPKSIIESQLPGKTDYCVLMRMKRDGLQGYMYQRFQNSYDVKLLRDAKSRCDCGSGEISKDCCHKYPTKKSQLNDAPIWKMHHRDRGLKPCAKCPNCICLYLQHYSRCIAAHALLLMPEDNESDRQKAADRMRLLRYYLGNRVSALDGPITVLEQDADVSCKLNVALKLIREYEQNGHKTIIFYESLRLGAILQRWATNKGLVFEVIDGSITNGLRQDAVDRFNKNTSCSIFFISKKAGGTGLNICGADRVLIFEPCWNPTLDLQAGDRAHRLGQKRVVHITRLVVENTIEHYVFKTAISKTQISNAILDNTREEWRVKEGEVGSMHAMLSMGDAFTDENESMTKNIQVIKADELNDHRQSSMEGEPGTDGLSGENARSRNTGVDDESLVVDVLGESEMCSLNVDVPTEGFPGNLGDNELDIGMMPTGNSGDEDDDDKKIEETDRAEPGHPPESQIVADLLDAQGASRKLVMSSTSARKRKLQVMGRHTRQSGINADGPDGMNFDDARWDGNNGQGVREEMRRHMATNVMEMKINEDDEEVDSDEIQPMRTRRHTKRPRHEPGRTDGYDGLALADGEEILTVQPSVPHVQKRAKPVTRRGRTDTGTGTATAGRPPRPATSCTAKRARRIVEDEDDDWVVGGDGVGTSARATATAKPRAGRKQARVPAKRVGDGKSTGWTTKAGGGGMSAGGGAVASTGKGGTAGEGGTTVKRPLSAFAARARVRR